MVIAPTVYNNARPGTPRFGVFPENVHPDALRAGARDVATRRTIDSEASTRSATLPALLKSLFARARQKADASVASPARSRSSRLRKTASRTESRTAPCGTPAPGEVGFGAVLGAVAGGRAESAFLGGVSTFPTDWAARGVAGRSAAEATSSDASSTREISRSGILGPNEGVRPCRQAERGGGGEELRPRAQAQWLSVTSGSR